MDINEIIRQVTEEVGTDCGPKLTAPEAGASIAKYIDHTLLKPEASLEDIRRICEEAKQYHTASVCVNPSYIRYVAE